MIDRARGANSLLAQFGLPFAKASLPHPKVANYNSVFRDTEDPRFKRLVEWMNNSLKQYPPDIDYGIDYRIPRGRSSAPTTTEMPPPSTEPANHDGPATKPRAPSPNAPNPNAPRHATPPASSWPTAPPR
jgi:hypothetical protein